MSGELRNWLVISVVGVIWLTLVVVGLVAGDLHQLSVIADLVPLLFIGAALFERWGWRWRRLHPYVVQMPVVRLKAAVVARGTGVAMGGSCDQESARQKGGLLSYRADSDRERCPAHE